MTAQRGTATPQDGVETNKVASDIEEVSTEPQDDIAPLEEVEEFRGRNEELRLQFLQCNARIKAALAAGDKDAERLARQDRERVANAFVEKNTRFAVSAASPFLIGDHETRKDHLAAAMEGLWTAFVGTNPDLVDEVIVDEDGRLHAAAGWDPAKGTFTTFAGIAISGSTRRSVQKVEGTFTGISYNTFSQKPRVDQARRTLAVSLGRTPTLAEIAKEAHVTVETVRACSAGAPVSLDTPVSDDGSMTLKDRLEDEADREPVDVMSLVAEDELIARVSQMAALDLLVLVLRAGLTGRPSLTVNRTADKLCVGRGAAQLAIKRALAALVPEEAVPETVRCQTCAQELAYDWDGEPQLTLTEFDVPSDVADLTVSQYESLMAQWTERVNAAHREQEEAHRRDVIAYRRKAREAAQKFTAEHRRHNADSDGPVDLADLLSATA